MNTTTQAADPRYAKVIEVSKRVRWEIERDVFRGRSFDFSRTFLPSGLSLVNELSFLSPDDKRLLGQVQGRTYAYIFGLVERYIGAKTLELGRAHAMGDQVAFEALVRMTDEELKHQQMFRRIEAAIGAHITSTPPDSIGCTSTPSIASSLLSGARDPNGCL